MVSRRVLLIGDSRHGEFSAATAWLAEHCLLSVVATPAAAVDALQHPAQPPELVVVAQVRPDQFSRAAIETIHRLAPLARLAVLAGSWCEGEVRTGHPWPGVLRWYWHQGEARLREMLTETSPLWLQPRTGTEVERLLDLPAPRETGERKLMAIGAESSQAYLGLADACLQAGYSTVWMAPHQKTVLRGAVAGIWDVSQLADSLEPLRSFTAQLHPAPVVALVNFPRQTDVERLQGEGVGRLVAKPFMNADLFNAIEQLCTAASCRQFAAA